MILLASVDDAGELTGPVGIIPGKTHAVTPSTRTPEKRAGVIRWLAHHGLIWDHTVFTWF